MIGLYKNTNQLKYVKGIRVAIMAIKTQQNNYYNKSL